MPIYEYRCEDCRHRFSVLVGIVAGDESAKCPKCESTSAKRLVSRFVRGRNEDARVEELADQVEAMGSPDSPDSVRKMMREVGKAMDEDLSDEMEEMFEMDQEDAS
ncbi:MAG: zinc ribbon domain-containing protein [Chthonomonas sp.]|nr:zinc ribbon domain-containing protein [Chthonomonas sp.]